MGQGAQEAQGVWKKVEMGAGGMCGGGKEGVYYKW